MLYGKENALNLYRFFGDVGGAKRNYDGGKFKYSENKYTSIVASIYPADKKDFRLNPYRVFGVNGAEPRY